MKKGLVFLLMVFFCNTIFAQEKTSMKMFTQGSSGIVLLDDEHFALFGYSTFIPGIYSKNEKGIYYFIPTIQPTFRLFGRHNSELEDSAKIRFEQFEDGKTYLKLGDFVQKVFNDDANCFSGPYQKEFSLKSVPSAITFFMQQEEDFPPIDINNYYDFKRSAENEFIAIFQKPLEYWKPFSAKFDKKDGKSVLEADFYGSFTENEISDGDAKEILNMYQSFKIPSAVYENPENGTIILEDNGTGEIPDYLKNDELKFEPHPLKNLIRYMEILPASKENRKNTPKAEVDRSIFVTKCTE